jgi:hypothetical protein
LQTDWKAWTTTALFAGLHAPADGYAAKEFAIAICDSKDPWRRHSPPYAFTEHGAVMLASVLNSPVAVEASMQVVRAFVRLRQLILTSDKLRRKLARIENKLQDHDQHFAVVFDAIRQLMAEDEDDDDDPSRPRIGYEAELKK